MIKDINDTQLFIAGSIITKMVEELQKNEFDDKDVEKAYKYLFKKFDEINKEIAEEIIIRLKDSFDKMKNSIEEN